MGDILESLRGILEAGGPTALVAVLWYLDSRRGHESMDRMSAVLGRIAITAARGQGRGHGK